MIALPAGFDDRRAWRSLAIAALVALLLALPLYWWFAVRWKPPPSIFDAPVDDVLGYLALDDFNKLPLDERLKFMMDFAGRFRGMEAGDSAAMAGFMAGVTGPAREQMTKNARQLAKDVLADGSKRYLALPAAERAKFLDQWLVEWERRMRLVTRGNEGKESDADRLKKIKDDVKRSEDRRTKRMADGRDGMPDLEGEGAVAFMDFWQQEVESTASPAEQGQIGRFLEDMRKHLSGVF